MIIDDHQLFGDVIRSALEATGMEVLGVAANAADGVAFARAERPDVALVDLGLPDESGLIAGKRILETLPDCKVVAVTGLSDPSALSQATRFGFAGFLTKDIPLKQFIASINAVLEGQMVVPGNLARRAIGALSPEDENARSLISQLTSREQEVLALMARGAPSADIARELAITPNTVRTHVQNLLMKLGVHSRVEAVAYAARQGLVGPNGSAAPRR